MKILFSRAIQQVNSRLRICKTYAKCSGRKLRLSDAKARLFWGKVRLSGDCWEWDAAINSNGYGVFNLGHMTGFVHRISYYNLIGSMRSDRELDHLCANIRCLNPLHLESVTSKENNLRSSSPASVNSCKTMCKRGHFFDVENTYIRKDTGTRQCRRCGRDRNRRRGRVSSPFVRLISGCIE